MRPRLLLSLIPFTVAAAAFASPALASDPPFALASPALAAPPLSGTPSITDALSADGTAIEVTALPAGTTRLHVAVMADMRAGGIKYFDIPATQTRYVPDPSTPVVDMQASADGAPIGDWAGRIQTAASATPQEEPPPGEAPTSSISASLSADRTAIEVDAVPAGTTRIHLAVMTDLRGDGIKYLDIPATQTRYLPDPSTPVVDVQAFGPDGAIGGWAGRIQTTPPAPTTGEPPADEPPKEEAPAEEPPKEEAPAEEPPTGGPPAEEGAPEEPPIAAARSARMIVGLDTGGWAWAAAVKDFSGAVGYIRSSYTNYNSDSQMALLSKHGVHLLPLFNEWSAAHVLAWFRRYGHGGSFWAGRADLGATTVEIVNEPGNPYLWGGGAQTDQSKYAATVEAYARALDALPAPDRPRLLVSYDGGFEGDNYGRALVQADPALLRLNLAWTVHPYGGKANRLQSAVGGRARVEGAHADTGLPVYVTEVGWPTAVGQPPTGDSLQWTEQQQAENITTFARWAHGLGYVRGVAFFNYADYGSNDWYGIVNTTGTRHKLSYSALASAAARW